MAIENAMYFALGLLVAGLLTLITAPAIWRRAVRLTKKRIEAATPMTMAEFRADKDQLRAEFALTTRRLEMTVESLRARLAAQLGELNQSRVELKALQTERDTHKAIAGEYEAREGELRRRAAELERENADLSQRLRMRERDYALKVTELAEAREELGNRLAESTNLDGERLSGDYKDDVAVLLAALSVERKRARFVEEQANALIKRLELGRRSAGTDAAIVQMRAALARQPEENEQALGELMAAEARISSAESRLAALLDETRDMDTGDGGDVLLLAERLSLEDQVQELKAEVLSVQASASAGPKDEASASQLRARLDDIATQVSHIVYAAEDVRTPDSEESLFDRVQRFASDGVRQEALPVASQIPAPAKKGPLAERVAALSSTRVTEDVTR